MYEAIRTWHVRQLASLPPRMLSVRDFYSEMLAPASRFRLPFSLFQELRLHIEAAIVPRLLSSSAPLYIEKGAPLNWRLIFNYLRKENFIVSASPSSVYVRNDVPAKKNVLFRCVLPKSHDHAEDTFVFASGSHENIEVAYSKAVGEILERMTTAWHGTVRANHASAKRMRALRVPMVDPTLVPVFSEEQQERSPRFRFDDAQELTWVTCEDAVSGTTMLAPFNYFYWIRGTASAQGMYLHPATTSGMAGGFTRGEALEAGLREYIERDAFLYWWLSCQSPARIDLSAGASTRLALILDEARSRGLEVYFLDLTCDTGVPVCACVLLHPSEGGRLLTVGASAKTDPEDALVSAYQEALSVMGSDGTSDREDIAFDPDSYVPFANRSIGLKERAVFYRGEERLKLAHFFYNGSTISYADFASAFESPGVGLEERTKRLMQQLSKVGCRIFVHYPAHRVLRKLRYHVASVFVPDLLPMYLRESDAPLAHPRLATILERAGRTQPYPYPHPFP